MAPETSQLTIYYLRSEPLRQRLLVEWGTIVPVEAEAAIDLALLSPEARQRLVTLAGLPSWGYRDDGKIRALGYTFRDIATGASLGWQNEVRITSEHLLQDEELTAENLLTVVEAWAAPRAAAEAEAVPLRVEAARLHAERAAERYRRDAEEARSREIVRAGDAKREAEAVATRARAEADKAAWVAEHGDDGLKARLAAGYNCQRRYVRDRAEIELPGFRVDFDNHTGWKSRACPGDDAFALVERLVAAGHAAQVVWLTTDLDGRELDRPDDDNISVGDDDRPQREAVVVDNYLGRYIAIKEF